MGLMAIQKQKDGFQNWKWKKISGILPYFKFTLSWLLE